MLKNVYKSLREATYQDRGIVIYVPERQIIVCDCTKICPTGGLPVLSWQGGLRSSMDDEYHNAILETNKVAVDDIREMLPRSLDRWSLYDPIGAHSNLLSSDWPKNCIVHEVKCYGLTATVLVPPIWRFRDWSARRLLLRSRRVFFVLRRVAYGRTLMNVMG